MQEGPSVRVDRRARPRAAGLAGALLVLLAAPICAAPPATAAPDPCQVSASFYGSIVGTPTSSRDSPASSFALVDYVKPPGVQAVLRASASTDTAWPVAVYPEVVVVDTGSTSEFFLVEVRVPAGAPAGTAGFVELEVEVALGGFACPTLARATTAVVVQPYLDGFAGRIAPGTFEFDSDVGFIAFDLEVAVRANTPVDVTIAYRADRGIAVEAPSRLHFEPGFTQTASSVVHVEMRAPHLRPGSHDVNITVTAQAEELPQKQGELGFTIIVPRHAAEVAIPGWTILAVLVAVAAAAGVTLAYWRRRA